MEVEINPIAIATNGIITNNENWVYLPMTGATFGLIYLKETDQVIIIFNGVALIPW